LSLRLDGDHGDRIWERDRFQHVGWRGIAQRIDGGGIAQSAGADITRIDLDYYLAIVRVH